MGECSKAVAVKCLGGAGSPRTLAAQGFLVDLSQGKIVLRLQFFKLKCCGFDPQEFKEEGEGEAR